MSHTSGPWKLIWHGHERYPYPLSIHTADDKNWIVRDGTVARPDDANLIAAAPDLLAALKAIIRDGSEPADMEAAIAAIAKAEGRE